MQVINTNAIIEQVDRQCCREFKIIDMDSGQETIQVADLVVLSRNSELRKRPQEVSSLNRTTVLENIVSKARRRILAAVVQTLLAEEVEFRGHKV